ncbi:MAG: hypothetical protein ABI767_12105, partial [Rhodanobacter sp.]
AERQISQSNARDFHADACRIYVVAFRASTRLWQFWLPQPRDAASIRFLFVRPALGQQLPSDSASRRTPSLFGYTLPLAGWVKDFHLQVVECITTMHSTARVKALRAMPGAPTKNPHLEVGVFGCTHTSN